MKKITEAHLRDKIDTLNTRMAKHIDHNQLDGEVSIENIDIFDDTINEGTLNQIKKNAGLLKEADPKFYYGNNGERAQGADSNWGSSAWNGIKKAGQAAWDGTIYAGRAANMPLDQAANSGSTQTDAEKRAASGMDGLPGDIASQASSQGDIRKFDQTAQANPNTIAQSGAGMYADQNDRRQQFAQSAQVKSSKPTTWQDIYNMNKDVIGANPNLLKPGQQLKMPDGSVYQVKPGDNLGKIAMGGKSVGQSAQVKPVAQPEIDPNIAAQGAFVQQQLAGGNGDQAQVGQTTYNSSIPAKPLAESPSEPSFEMAIPDPRYSGEDRPYNESVTFTTDDPLARILSLARGR